MSYHILEVYKITCISSKSSSWYKYFVYTVFVHGRLYSLQNMASLHSSPWTPYNIHVGHSPRNGSVPAVSKIRCYYKLVVNNFSKGSATDSVGVIERRALFQKNVCFSFVWFIMCITFAHHRFVLPHNMQYVRAPFLFNRDFGICARKSTYIPTHIVCTQCCFYWCCPSCTLRQNRIYPRLQNFNINENIKRTFLINE